MTNEEWLKLDEKDAVLSALERQYKKPRYDPFEVFQPTKAFIKEVIKSLKQNAYATQRKQIEIKQSGWPEPSWLTTGHTKLIRRIREYEYRLSGGTSSESDIGSTEIRRAKEYPIAELYTGQIRRTGRTLVGCCPFHDEKTGSFTIFTDSNRFTCFGCNVGGDSIDFIMARDNLSFIEVVKKLQ